jgi:hypothetical protein
MSVAAHTGATAVTPPIRQSLSDCEPDIFQVGLWSDADLPVGSSSADRERAYREAVKLASDASALRRQLPALVMAAARAGARAQKQQAEVAKDLGISRAKVSRLYGVMALEARLADEGVELPAGVCESHLEALLPLDHQRRLGLIDSMRERSCSVAWLRAEISAQERPGISLTAELQLVGRHLGPWLRRDWARDTEGLMPAFEALTRDVAMATAVRTTAPINSSVPGDSDG